MLRVPRLLGRPHRSARLHPLPERFTSTRPAKTVFMNHALVFPILKSTASPRSMTPNMRQSTPNGQRHRGRKGLREQSRGRPRQRTEGGCETRLANLEKNGGPDQHRPPKRRRY